MRAILIKEPSPFFSQHDEDVFFEWIEYIDAVKEVVGAKSGLEIKIDEGIKDEDLMELISLFSRYSIDMKCLRSFCNPNNEVWFKDKSKYWYDLVFGA